MKLTLSRTAPRAARSVTPLRSLAALALIAVAAALLLVFPSPQAHAQEEAVVTLVDNTVTTTTTPIAYSLDTDFPKLAQSFTTGSNVPGYRLASIGVRLALVSSGSNSASELIATINKNASGDPGSVHCELTNPDSYTTNSVNTFTAPFTCVLARSRTYFVVVERVNASLGISGDISWAATNSDSEDTAAAGWSIGNDFHYYSSSSSSWSSGSNSLQIEVKGSAVPATAPSISSVTISSNAGTDKHLRHRRRGDGDGDVRRGRDGGRDQRHAELGSRCRRDS